MAAKKKRAGRRRVTIVVERDVYEVPCARCGTYFEATSSRARFCSDACRQADYRERQKKGEK
ncbi:MAG: hypothetical protein R3F35_01700 [Myxococcota bacterium]